jgi:transglutaminase-like putative cysteine protease
MRSAYLAPTGIIDSTHPQVVAYTRRATAGTGDAVGQAVALFYAVRDGIRYDPYTPFFLPEHYRASRVIVRGRHFCVGKAALLCALARSCGLPARIGFATVRNHLATEQLIAFLGCDLFAYHAYTELYLEGKWVKATPAFNRELCRRHGSDPLAFDGRRDALFQPFNRRREQYMEYVAFHGTREDVPVDEILTAWKQTYGQRRVEAWIAAYEDTGGQSIRRFNKETVFTPDG